MQREAEKHLPKLGDWTNDFTLQFLEGYKNEPVLWNPKHKFHKDKRRVGEAWERLSDKLGLSVAILKRKKESLMATFRSITRRKKAIIKTENGSSDCYRPVWFAYELMDSFLGSVVNCITPTFNNPADNETDKYEEFDLQLPSPVDSQHFVMPDPEDPLTNDEAPQMETNLSAKNDEDIHPELQAAKQMIYGAFSSLSTVLNKKRQVDQDDDCDLYGKLMAKKLRRFPYEERMLVMYEIDGMLLRHFKASRARSSNQFHPANNNLAAYIDKILPSPSENNITSRPTSSHSNYTDKN
ncbi:unnamed protein product [Acanthoscelides obtectus]|uniref:MADF domain-containing protein n=1 Tax=Acanthoscelides obtectus TaxID=200917 RepID=A0A9P0M2T4_ACAOB|nr:unnamed protein product [Acanthoscelides obtectus]CAK1678143.1 hypothetical protein AOBTE_LOCUS31765 [Acanthoscelides obtectus]